MQPNAVIPESLSSVQQSSSNAFSYCPSRWLMAYHDPQAAINTLSSHMSLADLNGEGESFLSLIDIQSNRRGLSPFTCRLRVYKGQQLVYNHFLEDVPACLVACSIKSAPNLEVSAKQHHRVTKPSTDSGRVLLALPINDDIYFYHRLRSSHKLSLEDDPRILDTLNKSEYETWQMVRQKKVDSETVRELLVDLLEELGPEQLTSHSRNYVALNTPEERHNYLLLWRLKQMSNGVGEHLMSMDTICCAAARLRFCSSLTRANGASLLMTSGTSSARYNRILGIQKEGLLVGTEDRHLLVYELRPTRAQLEANYRLPAVPDHILVERKSPALFEQNLELTKLTYKILVSCRDCRIYSIDQRYLLDEREKAQVKEFVVLKYNVVDLCWSGDEAPEAGGEPSFIAATIDRKVYCFSGKNGACEWLIECELPIQCIVSVPMCQREPGESHLIGVASQTNRIDFYGSRSGRILDSIYLNKDNCKAMIFGRFGREDNCLCLVSSMGHLLIFILRRTAQFKHGQCLSSAAAHTARVVSECSRNLIAMQPALPHESQSKLSSSKLGEPCNLPSSFALVTKANRTSAADDVLQKLLQSEHNCTQHMDARRALDAHLLESQLQVPSKSRHFVDNIVEQLRHSPAMSRLFAGQLVKLRDKMRSTMEQETDLMHKQTQMSRASLVKVVGLGNTYQVYLSLRFNLAVYHENRLSHLLSSNSALGPSCRILISSGKGQCQLKPFKFEFQLDGLDEKQWILERSIEFKLIIERSNFDGNQWNQAQLGSRSWGQPAASNQSCLNLDIYATLEPLEAAQGLHRPVFISSVNIPTC